jgi:microcin C transport system permease protein
MVVGRCQGQANGGGISTKLGAYILKRILLMIPTLVGVMLLTFAVTQFVPGGPIERIIAQMEGNGGDDRLSGGGSENVGDKGGADANSSYRGAKGLDPEIIKKLEKDFGFDKPPVERFFLMMKKYVTFDFGQSYFRSKSVIGLIGEKLPVSMSLGIWLLLITYLVSIPLGIAKAVKDGTSFDIWTSAVISIGYAIPSFVLAIFLIIVFAGGSYFSWFPLRLLTSDNFADLSWWGKIKDYAWHLVLPLTALGVGAFATMTLLTKNSFLDEIKKQYVVTARAKGLTERRVLYGHVFRNAMMLVISGFPGAFLHAFFTGSLLIEQVFSLDGLGYLTYKSVLDRDYAVVFANLYIFTLIGLIVALISDLLYMWIDPRIDFEARDL